MVKIDLITGFLGAGKTTFIKEYVKHLLSKDENICILENDFGAVNVDMMLLQDLMGDCCELEMVAGGCDYDCHKRRFKTKLISMGMCGYDRVIVEPSGVYDMDEFFDTLREDPLDRWYTIDHIFTIMDCGISQDISDVSRFLLAAQVSSAGQILFSHQNEHTAKEKREAIAFVQDALNSHGCDREIGDIIWDKDWNLMTSDDWNNLMSYQYHLADYRKMGITLENAYDSVCLLNIKTEPETLVLHVQGLWSRKDLGHIVRIKGFFRDKDGTWQEINATAHKTTVSPIREGQDVLIIIGENLASEDTFRALL